MTLTQAYDFLQQRRRVGVKLGLDNMQCLAALMGHPERRLQFLHIAGTNGKGSTAAFCASILQEAGCRVGLYTSPHLIHLGERIQIHGQPLEPGRLGEAIERLKPLLEKAETESGSSLTFFEAITALALQEFDRAEVDWVVWETGLGGRLDATNLVVPRVAIITSIGWDHMSFLGDTLVDIAVEKAGIIKPGVPVVNGVENREAWEVIQNTAARLRAPTIQVARCRDLGIVDGQQQMEWEGKEYRLGLLGAHQARNAGCAVAAIRELERQGVRLPETAVEAGLQRAAWPGRFQVWRQSPLVVLDGAHNEEGVEALLRTWNAYTGGLAYHLICGFLADKQVSGMVRHLAAQADRISIVRVANERSQDPKEVAPLFSGRRVEGAGSLAEVWAAHEARTPAEPVLMTGSLFLVGEFLSWQTQTPGDFMLNERLTR